MNLFHAFILGIIQGLTEFIPVSSTAHLLVGQELLNIPADEKTFSFVVLVQLGTLLSLLFYFGKDLWPMFLEFFRKPLSTPANRLAWLIIVATIPALLVGFIFKNLVEELFTDPLLSASIRLFMSAMLLFFAERSRNPVRSVNDLNWKDAIIVGLAQVLAIFPGASRSGSTVFGGMVRGLRRYSAARFAFLMSIPVMLAAGFYEMIDVIVMPGTKALLPSLVVGFVSAAVVGWLAVKWLLAYLSQRSLYVFSVYCAILGVVVFGFWLF